MKSSFVRDLNIGQSSREERSVTNIMTSAKGRNIREASLHVDRNIAGTFDPAKGRTVILGKDLARENIYQAFDSVFRKPRVNINAYVAMTDGTAEDLLTHLSENEVEKAEFFYELFDSSE
ncbi:hypothetical protein [Oceanobacillus alkalisoli]|uniref:Ger(x)C family spore germination protein n=1 Tax=Oceanobacillus alkalisoli TaxID=2925113 RepID=UPI003F68B5AB